jgi:NADPH2:quinone reductase
VSLPERMRAVEITRPGGPEVLVAGERPVPVPGHGQILIRIAAAGVNRPDALQRAGLYNPPPTASDLPGLEAAGEVAALGSGVSEWQVGDKVCALLPGGGYADYAVTPAAHALPIPDGMDLTRAACLPETFFTVWSNVFLRAGLKAGERFLVHGGSSGIGTTAIQLARHFGARVFATAGSDDKCAACARLGAERAINYRTEDFVAVLKAEGGADVILDMVGGDYLARNLEAAAPEGRIVQIATLAGPKTSIDLRQVMMKRLTLTGSTLRTRPIRFKGELARALEETVWPLIAGGRYKPVIDSIFPLEDVSAAHERIDGGEHIGKIVLTVAE